jgi:hypothetical protein
VHTVGSRHEVLGFAQDDRYGTAPFRRRPRDGSAGARPDLSAALDRYHERSTEVVDANGRLLRAFTTIDGKWRLKTTVDDVDPVYLALLKAYEDRRFEAIPASIRCRWCAPPSSWFATAASSRAPPPSPCRPPACSSRDSAPSPTR